MPPSLRRSDILADRTLAGRAFCRAYPALVDDWLIALFDHAVDRAAVDGQGIALVAVGGQGRGELAPQSDLDLLLVYDRGVDDVAAVADALWYPIWDEGLKLGHAVRTVRDTLTLAAEDLETATALLSARHLAGDRLLSDELIEKSRSAWRRRGRRWLEVLSRSVSDRHHSAGEVAFDLEPDLKDGRGGLRDVHALQWAVAAGAEIDPATAASLAEHHDTLLAVRVELHRISPKPGDRLMLSDQDEVAARTGDADADALMARVAAAGRSIAWVSDESWDYIDLRSGGGLKDRLRRERHLEGGVVVRNGRVALADISASQEDPSALFHLALGAARSARRIDPAALGLLASTPAMAEPWPAEARRLFVELLLNGPASIPVIETLDQVGLWERLLPEWAAVRSLPQRNVFHRYTVDRHLLECSAEAASVSHRTPRPDLLVVGALLHDIAKGLPGDHSEVGARMAGAIATRMGFDDGDADTIAFLARHHLLLSDVATRRDLDDPATVQMVVDVVRTPERLALLRALSEADGLSTGPTAWGPWKAQLVDQLATRVAQALIGDSPRPGENGGFPSESQRELMCAGGLQVRAEGDRLTVVGPDRRGLFFRIAGALSLHGLDVMAANAWSEDGVALDEFRVALDGSDVVPWDTVEQDIVRALEGRLAIQARLDERARSVRRRGAVGVSQFPPRVRFDNDTASFATVLEAVGPDRFGLLHELTRALADMDLDVSSAKIHTMGGDVVDTFYVTDAAGQKVTDAEHQDEIRRALMHVLDPSG